MSDRQEIKDQPENLSLASGISLRDVYAAHALSGLLAGLTSHVDTPKQIEAQCRRMNLDQFEFAAQMSFAYADAMLKEREA